MTVRVGIIGVGVMGADHASSLDRRVSGATVTAVADVDAARASAVASTLRGATVAADGPALIERDDVDAVVIASHDSTHAELVHLALAAGKPVLCEKPLAPTAAECREIIAAQGDRTLITVGFMRRFDPAYVELKRVVSSGELGDPLVAHCVSRTVEAYPGGTSASTITNSAIHELDIVPWLLSSPITEVSWHAGRTSAHSGTRQDPQIMLLRTESDVLVTVEIFLNARYGYDTRCEVVGDVGASALVLPTHVVTDSDRRRSVAYPADWVPRYADAYRLQLQEWVDSLEAGRVSELADADAGLRAGLVADALVASMNDGGRTVVVE
ncbi:MULTISPECIES: Gfo/Idh/MocA family oxidoreductase [Nocardiaceae]|uniref:Myo-inositol 2-dehydrogenase/D-chiro-inositol 1-dehydrogenase n=1 Tax=Rhodococcoides corynebacterioides TaxID=53972 RepID=A0ABS2KPF8_9NOCA|nr:MULTISPECIES: Gfo/Idh/MocA family oxidoreductase [Rhodococcus]MBM7413861.1 myo-inositol 2-dehydrogenase/D-chiro-inositol 1-dehydrogenase [Rhodococcus corynebacterioides]MBP1116324.1 myo-inositol 2-dehydrogenase/D-chiro-inositol 1-dehydrogenase [Rhodococcus sp. PvP016]